MIVVRLSRIEFRPNDNQTHGYAKNGIRLNETKMECNEPVGLLGLGNNSSIIAEDHGQAERRLRRQVKRFAASFCGGDFEEDDFSFVYNYAEVDEETGEFWSKPNLPSGWIELLGPEEGQ